MENNIKKYWIMTLVALIVALGVIASAYIVTDGFVRAKNGGMTITVAGSAKKQIKSDLIVWKGSFSAKSTVTIEAYTKLKADLEKVKTYLKKKGIDEKDIIVSSINIMPNYVLLPNGMMTSIVESYRLDQNVKIKSSDVDKITGISREATELINEGVEFQSFPPEYYYTKIANLKVDMLGQATKDAKNRVDQIANNTGSKAGALHSAKMGVFQITPLYSTEVADSGINDTTSLDKEITAVVTCEFAIK